MGRVTSDFRHQKKNGTNNCKICSSTKLLIDKVEQNTEESENGSIVCWDTGCLEIEGGKTNKLKYLRVQYMLCS